MKVTGSILKAVLIVIVVILIILIGGFYLFGDYAIKVGIEKGGSAALGVPVTVGGIHLSLLNGMVTINGLQVENPAGYKNKYMLELTSGKVAVDIHSLLSDTVHVKGITLDGMNLAIEQKGLGSNVNDLLNGMKRKQQPAPAPAPAQKPQAEAKPKQAGKKLVIDDLEITNAQAKLAVTIGGSAGANLKLAPITMKNLGADKPLDIAELTGKIFVALIAGVAQQGAGLLPADLTKGMQSGLGSLTNLGAQGGQQIIKQGSNVIGGFKGLFQPKK